MIKHAFQESYYLDVPSTALVKMARYRMGSNDRRLLTKRASEGFVERIAKLELRPGEELAHNIALSTTERFGPNRNGDGFKAADCRNCHDTFVKYGHPYRNHINKDPKKSYGRVLASHFNEDMQRIELAIAYNATKQAADRNGNLVADKEMEKLAKGESFPSSMACHVRMDMCSGCGNKARTRDEYCHGSMCKYGGLSRNIGRVFEDGHHLHADNPNPRWFDISHIVDGRGADRTSFTLGKLEKAASCIKSGEAFNLEAPEHVLSGFMSQFAKAAFDLSSQPTLSPAWSFAFDASVQPTIPAVPDLGTNGVKLAIALRALADERVVLPLKEFAQLTLGDEKAAAEVARVVAPLVPDAIDKLADAGFIDNPYQPDTRRATGEFTTWARKVAADYSLDREAVRRRATTASLRNEKSVRIINNPANYSRSSAAAGFAHQYALYKVAALAAMEPLPDHAWLVSIAATQDRVKAR